MSRRSPRRTAIPPETRDVAQDGALMITVAESDDPLELHRYDTEVDGETVRLELETPR
ncbi:hypothetical protein [Halapricum hydrolyticum]|uniref:Uncharacterized protein n=1 Tax=Halapricum hydrolyticum TaxID=2979991 RepID=A0AAE3ICM3_9EURY|nr:hypothetical protein [Halapricum hydrolyticum]MCU4718283.1 hypothetical protein [Halapricum hydrolyticum]MCU4727269.1 hypothetical protein [Halapricum hydrolyticum]